MRDFLQKRWVLPAALRLRGETSTGEELHLLLQLARDPARAREVAKHRLREILAFAASEIPYYAARVQSGSELEAFPSLSKSDLVTHAEALRFPGRLRASAKTTGGSTGQAVTVWKNPEGIASERAATWMAFGWYGVQPGDRAIRLWGTGGGRARVLKSKVADLAMNRRTLSAFAFDAERLRTHWEELCRFRPRYVYGYASVIDELSQIAIADGLSPPDRSLRVVITTAEPLWPAQRERIARAFGVPVRNEYGCGEVGPIAYECEAGSLHLMESHLYCEVHDDEGCEVGPGGTGTLVVTDLMNRAMPLIRYRLEDSVTRAPEGFRCSCGRALSVLTQIVGRQYDFLEDHAGRRFHGEAVMYAFEALKNRGRDIQAFQIHQERPGVARVRFVSSDPAGEGRDGGDGLAEEIAAALTDMLGSIELTVERVPAIPRLPSGKHRLITRDAGS